MSLFKLTHNGVVEVSMWYIYDRLNRLSEAAIGDSTSSTIIAKYAYDANGNRTMTNYLSPATCMGYKYNDANMVITVDNRFDRPVSVISSFAYDYYLDGNQKSKTDKDGKVTSYAYDGMGRLIQESEQDGKTIAYTYDRFSNRATMTVSGTENYSVVYTYSMGNQLVSEVRTEGSDTNTTTYTYDANGSQLTKTSVDSTETRVYNGLNQLVMVSENGTPANFQYRPDGLRYSKQVGTGADALLHIHLWDGQNVVAEVGVNGTVNTRYLRGLNLIAREIDGAKQYYIFNAHGDVIHRVDTSRNVLKTYKYDTFGNEESPEPLDTNPFRYCGEYFDRETGTYYLRARNYDPIIGRFTTEDPARSTPNRFSYCGNNPIAYFDPSGCYYAVLDRELIHMGSTGAIIGNYTGTYSIVPESGIVTVGAGAIAAIPYVGNTLAKRVQRNDIAGDVIGGTSDFTGDGKHILSLSQTTNYKKSPPIWAGSKALGAGMRSLMNGVARGTVYDLDQILFGLMKIGNIKTSGYSDLNSLVNQMSALHSVINEHPEYFGDFMGGYSGSQFFADYRLYKMTDDKRSMALMQEAGFSLWDIWSSPNKIKQDQQYLNVVHSYNSRIDHLKGWLK